MVYLGYRRWLPTDHRFRRACVPFDGNMELHEPPSRPSGEDILRMAEEWALYLEDGD